MVGYYGWEKVSLMNMAIFSTRGTALLLTPVTSSALTPFSTKFLEVLFLFLWEVVFVSFVTDQTMFVLQRSRIVWCCQTKVPISGIIVQRHIDLQPFAKSCVNDAECLEVNGYAQDRHRLGITRTYHVPGISNSPSSHMESTNFDQCST